MSLPKCLDFLSARIALPLTVPVCSTGSQETMPILPTRWVALSPQLRSTCPRARCLYVDHHCPPPPTTGPKLPLLPRSIACSRIDRPLFRTVRTLTSILQDAGSTRPIVGTTRLRSLRSVRPMGPCHAQRSRQLVERRHGTFRSILRANCFWLATKTQTLWLHSALIKRQGVLHRLDRAQWLHRPSRCALFKRVEKFTKCLL
jgi:hypothetical protein